jgi:hypothetical protein
MQFVICFVLTRSSMLGVRLMIVPAAAAASCTVSAPLILTSSNACSTFGSRSTIREPRDLFTVLSGLVILLQGADSGVAVTNYVLRMIGS